MKEINIPAQIVMILAFLIMTSSFWCKKREKILKLQIISSILFVLQYVLLQAWTGAVLNAISIGRAFVFRKKGQSYDKEKGGINWNSNWILYAFVTVFIISSIITWDGWVSILPLMATLVYTFGMWADKPQYIRLSANVASVFWVSYNLFMGGYAGCFTECILFTSNTIALVKNKDKKNSKVVLETDKAVEAAEVADDITSDVEDNAFDSNDEKDKESVEEN